MDNSINNEWIYLISSIIEEGEDYAPRGQQTREILAKTTKVDMAKPVLTLKARKMGYRFLAAEAKWILSGDNRVASIQKYSKMISSFSDDGIFFNGAYGPMIVQQLPYILDCLEKDVDTRQAILTIWKPSPPSSKDIPCTISVQFLVRDGKLHCIDTMRSSDAWLGWVYDVFNFSMLSGYILLLLRQRALLRGEDPELLELGDLHLTAGSQHLYERNMAAAVEIYETQSLETFDYAPFNPYSFEEPSELLAHLGDVADRQPLHKNNFLKELYDV